MWRMIPLLFLLACQPGNSDDYVALETRYLKAAYRYVKHRNDAGPDAELRALDEAAYASLVASRGDYYSVRSLDLVREALTQYERRLTKVGA